MSNLRKKAMSAVSSESPRAAADLSEPSPSPAPNAQGAPAYQAAPPGNGHSADVSAEAGPADPGGSGAGQADFTANDFGANEWLVDELYQRYLEDPGSVDRAWWSFF
ncbi:MAG TPA: hypothetical protein VF482_09465, partial [Trebonia sp.]